MPENFRFTEELTNVDSSRLGLAEKREIEGLYLSKEYVSKQYRDRVVELEGERDLLTARVDRLTAERDALRERVERIDTARPSVTTDRVVASLGDALVDARDVLSTENYVVGGLDVELRANVISTDDGITLQLPDIGEPLERETLSTLRFSLRDSGDDRTAEHTALESIPDVRGRTADDARKQVRAAGFSAGEVTTEPGAEDDVVVGQFPSPHSLAEPGTAVDLTVSEQAAVDTPAVIGHARDDAVEALREADLVVEEEQAVDADAPPGTVVGQEPPAGTAVDPETVVRLTVASGANPTDRKKRDETDETAETGGADETFDAGDGVSTPKGERTRELQVIDGIGPTYAERLRESGIDSVDALLDADPDEVAAATKASLGRVERWLDAARTLDGGASR